MQVLSFRVSKFRNIVDSGQIAVDPAVTCLVGKNEAGKSGLLEALYLFNPAYQDDKFDIQEHYPRWLTVQDRRTQDLNEAAPISVTFLLDGEDCMRRRKLITKPSQPDHRHRSAVIRSPTPLWRSDLRSASANPRRLLDRLPDFPAVSLRDRPAVSASRPAPPLSDRCSTLRQSKPTSNASLRTRSGATRVAKLHSACFRVFCNCCCSTSFRKIQG